MSRLDFNRFNTFENSEHFENCSESIIVVKADSFEVATIKLEKNNNVYESVENE